MVNKCSECEMEVAVIMCDNCGCYLCTCCANHLAEMIECRNGGQYTELCDRCIGWVNDEGTRFGPPHLELLQGGKDV